MTTRFVAESFTNSIGQKLEPGNKVVYVGSGYNHSVRIQVGTFEGVYKGKSYWSGDTEDTVQSIRIGDVPGERWHYDPVKREGEYKKITRKAILPLKRAFKVDTPLTDVSEAF